MSFVGRLNLARLLVMERRNLRDVGLELTRQSGRGHRLMRHLDHGRGALPRAGFARVNVRRLGRVARIDIVVPEDLVVLDCALHLRELELLAVVLVHVDALHVSGFRVADERITIRPTHHLEAAKHRSVILAITGLRVHDS